MGRVLQIRVSASTYNPDEVEKYWPALVRLAQPESAYPPETYGVLELVQRLDELCRFGSWSQEVKSVLEPFVLQAAEKKEALEKALADWKVSEANALSFELEDVLKAMQKEAKKLKLKD